MNNEPVAWMGIKRHGETRVSIEKLANDDIPLYTHPVNPKYDPETGEPLIDGYPLFSGLPHPVKELTDEEILKVSANKFLMSEHRLVLLFARELLRKAQEK